MTDELRPPTETASAAERPASAGAPIQQPAEPIRTRTGGAYRALVAGAIVLALLLVFILENTQRVKVSYFGASGHLPLGVALLLGAVGGALLLGLVGTVRIMQLRRRVRRSR